MAKRRGAGVGKRRTREHVIADLSANHVERHALLCGYSVERVRHDYGIDLILFTYNTRGEVESAKVFLQLKATDRLRMTADKTLVLFKLQAADLRSWLAEFQPVILVVYDAVQERACWLYVQAYFEKLPRFDLKQVGAPSRFGCRSATS